MGWKILKLKAFDESNFDSVDQVIYAKFIY